MTTPKDRLSREDQAVLDALLDDAIATCHVEGVTDDGLILVVVTDQVGTGLSARKAAGDAQAARILLAMVYQGMVRFFEEEEAAGRLTYTVADALERVFARVEGRPRTQA